MFRCMVLPSIHNGEPNGTEVWVSTSMTDEGSCWWEGWWTPKTAEQWWATPKQEWRLIGHKRHDETLWPYVHMQHMIGIIL